MDLEEMGIWMARINLALMKMDYEPMELTPENGFGPGTMMAKFYREEMKRMKSIAASVTDPSVIPSPSPVDAAPSAPKSET